MKTINTKCKHRLVWGSCALCYPEHMIKEHKSPKKFLNVPTVKKGNNYIADMSEIRVKIISRKEQIAVENFLQSVNIYYEYDLPEVTLNNI